MDSTEVRKLTIVALFSDDELFEQIVLKGGNALSLVYGISSRTSLDLDFSIEKDFSDLGDTRRRIFRAVKDRFASAGFGVFDESFEPKPEAAKYKALGGSLENLRRNALVIGPEQQRKFSVDMSKHEYCEGQCRTIENRRSGYFGLPRSGEVYILTQSWMTTCGKRAINQGKHSCLSGRC